MVISRGGAAWGGEENRKGKSGGKERREDMTDMTAINHYLRQLEK